MTGTSAGGWNRPASRSNGGLSASDAAGAAIGDLLEAERVLRHMAEQTIRDLRAALQLAAYTFSGEAFEAEVRKNQAVLDQWTAGDWMAFFQATAPISRGWADPGVLAERLRVVTAERDEALAEVSRLQGELAVRAEASTLTRVPPDPRTPGPRGAGSSEAPRPVPAGPRRDDFPWPKIPSRPPVRYARLFTRSWQREGLALALVAGGVSMRLEAAELVGLRFGVKGRSGSIKRIFKRLVGAGLLEKEVVRVGHVSAMFVWLSELGREVCAACRIGVQEGEFQRLLRLHGGRAQREHAAAVAIFAYQARRRGFTVEVVPAVEGPAEPDAAIVEDEGTPVYVEVELGRDKGNKWAHQADLQGFVALCALNAEGRAALVAEIKDRGLAGRATTILDLIRDDDGGKLWTQEWD